MCRSVDVGEPILSASRETSLIGKRIFTRFYSLGSLLSRGKFNLEKATVLELEFFLEFRPACELVLVTLFSTLTGTNVFLKLIRAF